MLADVLQRGALLEDEHFHIAEKILRGFLAERHVGPDDRVILNGLPRHVGQADDVDRIVNVTTVVELSCTPETVMARLKADAGGDRAGRIDDEPDLVFRKLETYARRTEPLVEHYRLRGATMISLIVGPSDSAEDAWRRLRDKMGLTISGGSM